MAAYTKGLVKSAGVGSDALLGITSSLPTALLGHTIYPGLGAGLSVAVPVGTADYELAKASQQQKQKHIKKLNDNRAKALEPFNGLTRLIQRQVIADNSVNPRMRRLAGHITSLAIPATIGAIIGGTGGKPGARVGALAGLGVAGISSVIGAVAALLSRRRTLEQHRQIQKGNSTKQFLLPGYAAYDHFKALGASQNYATPEEQKQKGDKQSLQKQAKKDYTPYQWRKYTTSEQRQTLSNAQRKLMQKLKQRLIARMLLGGPIVQPLGALTAAATPTWDLQRLKQLAQDQNYATKASLIPGYDIYNTLKAIGTQRDIQNRVQRQAKKSKAQKQDKEDSKQKDDKQKDSKQSLQKQASRAYPYTADLGQGMKMQVESQDGQRLLRRVRELRKPKSVGRSFLQSLPIAAACALVSGLGTYAINGWKHPQLAGMAAAAGGMGATLLGTLQGSMSPGMSVGDAILRAAAEQKEQKQKQKPKQQD